MNERSNAINKGQVRTGQRRQRKFMSGGRLRKGTKGGGQKRVGGKYGMQGDCR